MGYSLLRRTLVPLDPWRLARVFGGESYARSRRALTSDDTIAPHFLFLFGARRAEKLFFVRLLTAGTQEPAYRV
jgi:hypothetical protein